MEEEKAREVCTAAFKDCPVNQINGIPVDPETYIEECTKDVSVSCKNFYEYVNIYVKMGHT